MLFFVDDIHHVVKRVNLKGIETEAIREEILPDGLYTVFQEPSRITQLNIIWIKIMEK